MQAVSVASLFVQSSTERSFVCNGGNGEEGQGERGGYQQHARVSPRRSHYQQLYVLPHRDRTFLIRLASSPSDNILTLGRLADPIVPGREATRVPISSSHWYDSIGGGGVSDPCATPPPPPPSPPSRRSPSHQAEASLCAHVSLCPRLFVPTSLYAQKSGILCPRLFLPKKVVFCAHVSLCPRLFVPTSLYAQTYASGSCG